MAQDFIPLLRLIMIAACIYAGYSFGRHPSEKRKIKDRARVDEYDAKRREAEEGFTHAMPRIIRAEQEEEQEIRNITQMISELKSKVNLEATVLIPQIKRLLRQETGKLRIVRREFPEGENVIRICGEENRVLEHVVELLTGPQKIVERIMDYLKREKLTFAKLTHKLDRAEIESESEDAIDSKDARAIHTEDKEQTKQKDDLLSVINDEREIQDAIWETRKKCRKMIDLNREIIDIVEARNKKLKVEKERLNSISEDVNKKRALLNEIIAELETVSVYEKYAERDSLAAEREGEKLEKAA